VAALALGALPAHAVTIDTSSLGWDVQYLIDNSQTVGGFAQTTGPRDNRGLALDPTGRYLYAGYNNGGGQQDIQVRKIDTTVADYTAATVAILPGHQGKAIATDSQGRVYLGDGTQVAVYDANLTTQLATITGFTAAEGVTVAQEGSELALYVTDRGKAATSTTSAVPTTLSRFVVQGSGTGTSVGSSIDKTPLGATQLRGVEVDPNGNVWAADFGGNTVYELVASGWNSFLVDTPMDIAFDDTQAFITQYKGRQVTVVNQTTRATVATVTPPWGDLALDPDGQSKHTTAPTLPGQADPAPGLGALSGIDIAGGLLYISNEAGQTANTRSLWGALDGESGIAGGIQYTDLTHDDNEPILVAGNAITTPLKLAAAQVPEPASLLLVASTAFILVAKRRTGRRATC